MRAMRPRWSRSPDPAAAPPAGSPDELRVPRENGVWRVEKALAGFRGMNDRSDEVPPRSRELQEHPVSEDELEQVTHEYRRLHEEHRRAKPRSRTRRHLDVRLLQLRRRFERLLAEAPLGEGDRRRWRSRLREEAAAPSAPVALRPLLFQGRSDAGSELRLTAAPDGTVDVLIDGSHVAVLDAAHELTETAPDFVFALDDLRFRETFGASRASLADLRDSVETGRRPRPAHVRELIADGLVDRTLGLTARGRRALALDRAPTPHVAPAPEPAISTRGRVPQGARDDLARTIADVAGSAPEPVLRLTGSLTRSEDPAVARPIVAKATIDVNGRVVHAHAAAASERDAIDLLEARLRRNVRSLGERDNAARRP
jgi:hypothetical protein